MIVDGTRDRYKGQKLFHASHLHFFAPAQRIQADIAPNAARKQTYDPFELAIRTPSFFRHQTTLSD